MRLRHLGVDRSGLDMFLLELGSWSDWPPSLALPSPHFRLLMAADASNVVGDELARLAGAAIEAGCAYLCAWGPDCNRVHIAFDMYDIDRPGHSADSIVMTTSHNDESLEDALEFALISAWPAEAFEATCRAVVVAVVDDAGLTDEVRRLARKFVRPNPLN